VANPTETQSGSSKVNVASRISCVFLAEPRARPWPGVSLGVITHSLGVVKVGVDGRSDGRLSNHAMRVVLHGNLVVGVRVVDPWRAPVT
jgi:hypothetical protein